MASLLVLDLDFKSQRSVVRGSSQGRGNRVPVDDAVEGQQMQIVQAGEFAVKILSSQIVVKVGLNDLVSKLRHLVF